MTRIGNRKSVVCISTLLLLLAVPSVCVEAAEPKRVLIVHSFGRDFSPHSTVGLSFRTSLTQLLRQPVAFYEVSIDVERGGSREDEQALLEYLLVRSRITPPDLVVAVGGPAMVFCLRHRAEFFRDRPLLIAGTEDRWLAGVKLGDRDRVVTVSLDLPGTALTVLQVRPETKTLALVLGASPLEQFWTKEIQRELAPLADRLRVLALTGLNLDEMRGRVAALPPNSAVLYGMFAVGADGAQHENERALAAIRKSSNAPVFGFFVDQLGNGIVGGSLLDTRKVGSVSAEIAVRMLEGKSDGGNRLAVAARAPAFDWRELQHWDIPESRLPAGAEVLFRPRSIWEEHKLMILAGGGMLLFQAALIAALLLQRARRWRAEREAIDLSGRLLTAHEDERRRLARELHDDLTQRLARMAIDAGQIERRPAAALDGRASALRHDLVRMSEDVHALSYRLHPSVLDDLGLVEALKTECDHVSRRGDFRVDVDASGVPDSLSGEVSLCLFRVAQEALSNAARHARASAVSVRLSPNGKGLQLAVSDNGSGFNLGRARERASLGVASMRERVRVLHGELDIESTPGHGTTVLAWVPV